MTLDDAFALTIGISAYRHVTALPAVHDAQDVADLLADPQLGAYPPDQVHTLSEEAATRTGILDALDRLARRTTASSTVFLYFSGHGGRALVDGRDEGYLLAVDSAAHRVEDLERTAIAGRDLSARLRAIPAARLTVVLDCCRAAGLAEPKDVVPSALEPALPPATLSLLASGRGRAVFAASRSDGFAYVRAGQRNGIFTGHLLEGLRGAAGGIGGVVRVCDLFHYVQQKVVMDHPAQRPVFKAELEENYPIALYRGGQAPALVVPAARDSFAYDAFISYSSADPEDRTWVEAALVPHLERAGLRFFLETRDSRLGRARIREMERAVIESRYTVAVLTPAYLAGPFQEFQSVLAQHLATETSAPRFVPILRKDCRPPLGMRTTAALDVTDDARVGAALERLAVALREPPHPTLGSSAENAG